MAWVHGALLIVKQGVETKAWCMLSLFSGHDFPFISTNKRRSRHRRGGASPTIEDMVTTPPISRVSQATTNVPRRPYPGQDDGVVVDSKMTQPLRYKCKREKS